MPSSALLLVVQVGLIFTGFAIAVRLARRAIRLAVWSLRNRLVVAYIFIAVVPIVLMLLLAARGADILTGQITAYLLTHEIDKTAEALLGPARVLLASPAADRESYIRRFAPSLQQRYPGFRLLVRDGGEWRFPEAAPVTAPMPGHGEAAGLVLRQGHLYLWAHAARGPAEAVLMAPLTRELIAGLAANLGEVTIAVALPSQTSGGQIPAAASRFDMEVRWVAFIPVARWDRPGEPREIPLGGITRPSVLLRGLFSERTDWNGVGAIVFLGIGVLFLLVESVALAIGVSMTRAITGAVHSLYNGTERVRHGDFSHRIGVRGNDQLAELGRSFNRMTENLERLLRVVKEQERLQAELEIAREVQSQLYPKAVPPAPGLELMAHCSPARTVSGDYYDYVGLGDSRLALAIGDVAGKGISAALLMATIQSALRTQIRGASDEALRPARLVSQLNQHLYAYTSAEKFATFYFGVYDAATSRLTYTNAGHPPPILIRDGEALRLETNGMVVGAFPFAEYGESDIELRAGDLLVCFTDGITEPDNEYGEMFGEERLIELLLKESWRRPDELIDTILGAVRQWATTPEAYDDMTVLVVRKL